MCFELLAKAKRGTISGRYAIDNKIPRVLLYTLAVQILTHNSLDGCLLEIPWGESMVFVTMRIATCVAMIAAVGSTPVLARDSLSGFSIGALAATTQSPYLGRSESNGIVPVFRYEGERLTIGSNGFGFKVLDGPSSKLSFHLQPRLSPLHEPSEPELAGISRDHSADAAIFYEYRPSKTFEISTKLSKGLTAAQDGTELTVAARGLANVGFVPLVVSGGASWKSAALGQYYYGVKASEAIVGRAAYDVGATTTPFVSISSSAPLGNNLRVFGSVRVDFLGAAITGSPIVAKSAPVSATFGISYGF